jgi:hypothetical protein
MVLCKVLRLPKLGSFVQVMQFFYKRARQQALVLPAVWISKPEITVSATNSLKLDEHMIEVILDENINIDWHEYRKVWNSHQGCSVMVKSKDNGVKRDWSKLLNNNGYKIVMLKVKLKAWFFLTVLNLRLLQSHKEWRNQSNSVFLPDAKKYQTSNLNLWLLWRPCPWWH